jgi:hypothetical protein
MQESRKLLTAVVPISRMADNLHFIEEWLPLVETTQLAVILVHDINDLQTSHQLHELVADAKSTNIKLLEGHFEGPGGARNFGLEQVITEWVTFWDSDDIPHVGVYLEAISKVAHKTQVIVHNFEILDNSTKKAVQAKIPNNMLELGCQAGIWRFSFRTNFARRSKFGTFRMGEDQVFLAHLPRLDDLVEFMDVVSYSYVRGHKSQLTEDPSRITWLNLSMAELMKNNGLLKSNSIFAITIGIRLSLTLIKSRNPKNALDGAKYLATILIKSDLGVIKTLRLSIKVAINAVKNV